MDSDLSVLNVESSHLHDIIIINNSKSMPFFVIHVLKLHIFDVFGLYFGVPCPAVCLDVFINVRNVLV